MRWLKRLFRKRPVATITTIEGKRHYSGTDPEAYRDWIVKQVEGRPGYVQVFVDGKPGYVFPKKPLNWPEERP